MRITKGTLRWTYRAAPIAGVQRLSRGRSLSSLPPVCELGAAQHWLQALKVAPCLVCDEGKSGSDAPTRFPVTCSPECDQVANAERVDQLRVFHQIHEDLAYTTTEDAKTFMTHVLTRSQREQQRGRWSTGIPQINSWEAFIQQFTDDARWVRDPRAVRLTSATYTFAATLSSFLSVLCNEGEVIPNDVELHVIGARAEATMPRHIWEELIDAHPKTTFNLKLIGDHVVQIPTKKALVKKGTNSCVHLEQHLGLYHHLYGKAEGLKTSPDAFVLFNPGIGHPKLKASWRPTMEMILQSGKPMLLTSFSQRDQDRDVSALEGMFDVVDVDFVVPPRQNAFSSRYFQLDPANIYAPIQTNSHVMVVRGRVQK